MRSQIKAIVCTSLLITALAVAPHTVAQGKPPGAIALGEPRGAIAPGKAFVVNQKHYFLGRWQTYVNGDKIKAVNLSEGYSIITMAPTWKVVFVRDRNPVMYETTLKTFMKTGLPLSIGYVTDAKINEAKKSRAKFKGLDTTVFSFARVNLKSAKPAWTLSDVPKDAAVGLSQYWVSPLISTNASVCNFLQRLFLLPATDGYPVAFMDTRTDNTRNSVLDILSYKVLTGAEVVIEYPSPTKYKLCKGARDVTLSTTKRDSFNEWAQALGKD